MGKGKRNSFIVISSSEDDEDNHSCSKTRVRFSTSAPTRKNSKRVKRLKRFSPSNSCPRSFQSSDSNGFEEVTRFCEEFDQGLIQFKVSSGCGRNQDLWVDKYKPTSLEELAVHKKKVEEVKIWFEERLKFPSDRSHINVLLISGQAGVGKSATIYAVASHLGVDVCEWNAPTPTIWQEHLHTFNSGIRYMSKLDEFESFVERIRKYGLVFSPLTRESLRSAILLIDDLPAVNGKASYARLARCLHCLLQSVCLPTVILINDYGKSDHVQYNIRYWEELYSSLQNAGACKVTFNPITVNSIKKTLAKIRRAEQFEASDEQIELIAKASEGDIRHAITSLQYFSLKPHLAQSTKCFSNHCEDSGNVGTQLNGSFYLQFGKDANLSLFHALGKFLHNKRDSGSLIASDGGAILLKDIYVRHPLKMDSPELVLCQAHGQARVVADFLQENVLDFVNEDAIEDAWVVSAYLSDADLLLTSMNGISNQKFEAEKIVESAAASIAVRGVLFGNTFPVSSRWHAIRRPKLWQAERLLWQNKHHIMSHGYVQSNISMSSHHLSVFATEFKPAFNWLGHRATEDTSCVLLNEVGILEDECPDMLTLDNKHSEEEDEIEDW